MLPTMTIKEVLRAGEGRWAGCGEGRGGRGQDDVLWLIKFVSLKGTHSSPPSPFLIAAASLTENTIDGCQSVSGERRHHDQLETSLRTCPNAAALQQLCRAI